MRQREHEAEDSPAADSVYGSEGGQSSRSSDVHTPHSQASLEPASNTSRDSGNGSDEIPPYKKQVLVNFQF